MTETKRPLTEEERRIVSTFLDGMDDVYLSKSSAELKQEWQKFKALQLEDRTPEEIENLLALCQLEEDQAWGHFGFIMMFDMWYHDSSIWPVPAACVEAKKKKQENRGGEL